MRILCMDDEGYMRELLGEMLKALGYESVAVGNSDEAITAYQNDEFDIVILDLTLPSTSLDGVETLEEIKKINPKVIALACSGYSDKPVEADYQRFGFAGFLGKPFNIEQLGKALILFAPVTERTPL